MSDEPDDGSFRPLPSEDYPALAGYGLVGDGHSAALVSAGASVDWWCPARFDRPSVFARLLDLDVGGRFVTRPPVRHRTEIGYEAETNVLCSVFTTADATVEARTFMPHVQAEADDGAPGRLVRLLSCERGTVDVSVELAPAFDYARRAPRFESRNGDLVATPAHGAEPDRLRLASTADLSLADEAPAAGGGSRTTARTTVRLSAGDEHAFVLDHARGEALDPVDDPLATAHRALETTRSFWRGWAGRCTYEGAYRDPVVRSLLTLKQLQYAPSGAFVAAPTTSLPERPGGGRNWDYRFAWIRDGYHIVMALESAGYERESRRFKEWLADILRRDASEGIQMLYRVDGDPKVGEEKMAHLEGYRRSSPVRVGNEAAGQHQLDTFGEAVACLHRAPGVFEGDEGQARFSALRELVDWVAEHWQERDSGLWELRGDVRHYVYGKVMAWVALDHGIQIAESHGFEAPTERWAEERQAVRAFVLEEGVDDELGAFTQTTERSDADAANLLIALLGFVDPEDERMQATIEQTREHLLSHGLCHRYIVDDRLQGNEGAFLVASFWLADALAAQGRRGEAREVFERARGCAGPLGLLAEEADPVSSELAGNHPQGLSHLGLVLAALRIDA